MDPFYLEADFSPTSPILVNNIPPLLRLVLRDNRFLNSLAPTFNKARLLSFLEKGQVKGSQQLGAASRHSKRLHHNTNQFYVETRWRR